MLLKENQKDRICAVVIHKFYCIVLQSYMNTITSVRVAFCDHKSSNSSKFSTLSIYLDLVPSLQSAIIKTTAAHDLERYMKEPINPNNLR